MKLFDKFLLWMSGRQALVLVENQNVVVILDRSGERYEWPCERMDYYSIRGRVVDLKRIVGPAPNGLESAIKVFPDDAVALVKLELSKKGMLVEFQ